MHEPKATQPEVMAPSRVTATPAVADRTAVLQRTMTVGPADDRYEREADAVAQEVVTRLSAPDTARPPADPPLDPRVGAGQVSMPGRSGAEAVRRQVAPLSAVTRTHLPGSAISRSAAPQLPVAQLHRSSAMVQRFWPFSSKKDEPKKKEFTGKGGALPSLTEEVGKPAAAGAVSGGAGYGTHAAMHAAGSAGIGEGASLGLGVLLAGDAALGLSNASKMKDEAALYGDHAMAKAADRKQKDQSWALAGGLAATAKGGAQVAHVAGHAAGAVAAAGGLGVAGGTAMIIQGAWRGGKAIQKYCRLTWGRGQEMLSDAGKHWKKVIVGSEKFKIAINGLKIAAGALGVAAGVLAIVSNPVGWAVGLAALIAGGVYAIGKIAGKVSNARDKSKAADKHAAQQKAEAAKAKVGAPENATKDGKPVDLAAMGYSKGSVKQAGPQNGPPKAKERGTGFKGSVKPMTPAGPQLDAYGMDVEDQPERMDPERKAAIEKANAIARDAGENAQVSHGMIQALSHGSKDFVAAHIQARAENPKWDLGIMQDQDDRQLYDAFMLLSSINVTPEEALADTGQDLIEKKLSKAEAM